MLKSFFEGETWKSEVYWGSKYLGPSTNLVPSGEGKKKENGNQRGIKPAISWVFNPKVRGYNRCPDSFIPWTPTSLYIQPHFVGSSGQRNRPPWPEVAGSILATPNFSEDSLFGASALSVKIKVKIALIQGLKSIVMLQNCIRLV